MNSWTGISYVAVECFWYDMNNLVYEACHPLSRRTCADRWTKVSSALDSPCFAANTHPAKRHERRDRHIRSLKISTICSYSGKSLQYAADPLIRGFSHYMICFCQDQKEQGLWYINHLSRSSLHKPTSWSTWAPTPRLQHFCWQYFQDHLDASGSI